MKKLVLWLLTLMLCFPAALAAEGVPVHPPMCLADAGVDILAVEDVPLGEVTIVDGRVSVADLGYEEVTYSGFAYQPGGGSIRSQPQLLTLGADGLWMAEIVSGPQKWKSWLITVKTSDGAATEYVEGQLESTYDAQRGLRRKKNGEYEMWVDYPGNERVSACYDRHGQLVEYAHLHGEETAIFTADEQLRYLHGYTLAGCEVIVDERGVSIYSDDGKESLLFPRPLFQAQAISPSQPPLNLKDIGIDLTDADGISTVYIGDEMYKTGYPEHNIWREPSGGFILQVPNRWDAGASYDETGRMLSYHYRENQESAIVYTPDNRVISASGPTTKGNLLVYNASDSLCLYAPDGTLLDRLDMPAPLPLGEELAEKPALP